MTPYEVFFFSSGGVEEKWTAKDIGLMRANVLIGFPLGGLLSLAITGSASLVLGPEGITVDTLGRVIDVRVRESRRVDGLVVGRGGPGSLLGYDRRRDQGPWLVGAVVRWRHRHTGYVGRGDILGIDWGHGVEVSVAGLGDLPPTT